MKELDGKTEEEGMWLRALTAVCRSRELDGEEQERGNVRRVTGSSC